MLEFPYSTAGDYLIFLNFQSSKRIPISRMYDEKGGEVIKTLQWICNNFEKPLSNKNFNFFLIHKYCCIRLCGKLIKNN
jgi:hypothetical protein